MKSSHVLRSIVAVAMGGLFASGCILLDARRDQQELARYGRIVGKVETEHASTKPLMVMLFPASEMETVDPDDLVIVDHFVRRGTGSYGFRVEPGEYVVLAFEDVNEDGNYDPDEPLFNVTHAKVVKLASGDTVVRDIVIPTAGRSVNQLTEAVDIAALQARSASDQQAKSLGAFIVRGEVADLSDEKFGSANGQHGLRKPLDFVFQVGAGVYMTEPYDPTRTVVLFIHGISGYPQEFTELIDSLDRSRFQAWFYFYPSGYRLDPLAATASDLMIELQMRHGFEEFVVVAHSMGGLVSRAFLFQYLGERGENVPLFLTLSTPWGGDDRAIKGVEGSPVVIPVWRDMASNSDFLKHLFWKPDASDTPRRLPADTDFHMMFSVRGKSRGDVSTDGSVAIASQLRPEAQEQAVSQLGLDYSHTGILRSDQAKQRMNALLDEYVD